MNVSFCTIKKSFPLRIAILVALLCVGVYMVVSDGILSPLFGIVILGAMFAHAVELQHQCLHYTAFRLRPLNRIVGIMLGLPTLTSFHAYRRSHLDHHRNLGTPNDQTFFVYKFLETSSLKNFAHDLLGVAHLRSSFSAILGNSDTRLIDLHSMDATSKEAERFDYGLMGFLIVAAILVAMMFGFTLVLKLWILPLLLVAQPIHFLIELPEHIGCFTKAASVFDNTRTIYGSSISSWFTNYNNLHVEHHLDASRPMAQLPELLEENRGKHRFISNTYPDFYIQLFKSLKSSQTETEAATDRSNRSVI